MDRNNHSFPKKEWKYDKIIDSGATSYVFAGKWNGKPAALKWVEFNQGKRETDMLCILIRNKSSNKDDHIIYPIHTQYGRYALQDIIGEQKVHHIITRLNRFKDGPKIEFKSTVGKHFIRNSMVAYIIIFPLMNGDLGTLQNAKNNHNCKQILDDIKIALSHLKSQRIFHNDVSLKNILYKTIDGKKRYYLTDFGRVIPNHGTYDIDVEINKLRHIFN